jgi:hypothetical protein
MPKYIGLDCELNASARFRRGWFSFFGSDMNLTIGLPLVAGMNTCQLAAVIAHELGHFTQGAGMRLGYVIDRIDRWFMRVIYARDSWDEALDDWANSAHDWRMAIVVACIHLAVWFSRSVLKILMFCGHAASCFLSRQMEFHADSYAIGVAGVDGFEGMLIRLREQSILQSIADAGLPEIWNKRHQLPDSIPDFLRQLERQMPPDFHQQAGNTLLNEKTGLWTTHPTAARRIQKARQNGTQGVFHLERPGATLFGNFDELARQVTSAHYRERLRLAVRPAMLRPATDFLKNQPTGIQT